MAMVSIMIKCKSCGNEFKHQKKCYNRSAAEDYEKWAMDNITLCPRCYIEMENQKYLRECMEIINDTIEDQRDFVDLRGTEKQIDWASEIRIKSVAGMIRNINPDRIPGLLKLINMHDDAVWWIDNRETAHYPSNMLDKIYENTTYRLINRNDQKIYAEWTGRVALRNNLDDFIKSNGLDPETLSIEEVINDEKK